MKMYDLPFTHWISTGLHRPSLETALSSMQDNEELPNSLHETASRNKNYIEKILREEVIRQFANSSRPLLEVVLNAVDAKPEMLDGEKYNISIVLNKKQMQITDNGTGMTLDQILRLLIIPFSTEKDALEDIGRFGVGFLSTLHYCLERPKKNYITVETTTAEEQVTCTFYATGETVGDLRMHVGMRTPKQQRGTRVTIRKPMAKEMGYLSELHRYLTTHLVHIPRFAAIINLNGKRINNTTNGTWYQQPVSFQMHERTYTQNVGLQISAITPETNENKKRQRKQKKNTLAAYFPKLVQQSKKEKLEGITSLLSQGILVQRHLTSVYNATVSFPPVVLVVEGREDFKRDANYDAAAKAVFSCLYHYLREQKEREPELATKMLSFIPEFASALNFLGCNRPHTIHNAKKIQELLFPKKQYVVSPHVWQNYAAFFGDVFRGCAVEVGDEHYDYWNELFQYKGANDFLKEAAPQPLKTILAKNLFSYLLLSGEYPNLLVPADYLETKALERSIDNFSVHFVAFPPGKHCILAQDENERSLYINVLHPSIQGSFDSNRAYAVLCDFSATELASHEKREKMIQEHVSDITTTPVQWGERWRARRGGIF